MRILNPCAVYKFQTVNPGCPPSQPHTFWSTAIRRDIRAALYFCSCELSWRSIECVLLACFNALPDIFAVMNCFVLALSAVSCFCLPIWRVPIINLWSLQWHIVAYNEYISGSQPGCRGTLGCHLQYPGVPRANAFFNILLKMHFQTVIKPWSKIVWVRHWVPQNIILFCRVPQA